MKVKIFSAIVAVSGGVTPTSNIQSLEEKINTFLQGSPNIKIIDIKFSSNAAMVQDGPTNYGLYALLIYQD